MKLAGRSKARKKLIFCRRGGVNILTHPPKFDMPCKKKTTIETYAHLLGNSYCDLKIARTLVQYGKCACALHNKKLLQYRHAKALPVGQPDGEAGLLSP